MPGIYLSGFEYVKSFRYGYPKKNRVKTNPAQ